MRSRIFFLVIVVLAIWSCEDPTTLPVSKVFNGNKLQTAYTDTFSVNVSTIQLDTFLTNGSSTALLGNYHDDRLGDVSASTYFQLSYSGQFLPAKQYSFDSLELILPYNHVFTGDTTVPTKINVYQLSKTIVLRDIPISPGGQDDKFSVFNITGTGTGMFNTSKVDHYPTPIASTTVKFTPRKDTMYIKLPYSFGANWFRLAQFDSGKLFSVSSNFYGNYFYGLCLEAEKASSGAVVGFSTGKLRIRMHYRYYVGDFLKKAFTDFGIVNVGNQFNHIEFDRSTGTADPSLRNAGILNPVSSWKTGHEAYVQQGTGLVARLDFPSLKTFFSIINGITINAAYLEIYPIHGTYPATSLPFSSIQLFSTDNSNMPINPAVTGGSANIQYDKEFGINTVYRFDFFPYLYSQLHVNKNYVTPVIVTPSGGMGTSVQRLYFGDQFHADFYGKNKIKLKIYYTYPLN